MFPKPQPGLVLTWMTSASSPPTLPTPSCHDFPAVILGLSPTRVSAFGGFLESNWSVAKAVISAHSPPHPDFPFCRPGSASQSYLGISPIHTGAGRSSSLPIATSLFLPTLAVLHDPSLQQGPVSFLQSTLPPSHWHTGPFQSIAWIPVEKTFKAFPAYSRIRSGPSYFVSFISSLNPTGSLWPKQPGHLKLHKVHRAIMPIAGPPHSLLPSPRWDIPCLLSSARGMEREGGIHKNSQA